MPFIDLPRLRVHFELADYTDPWRSSAVVLLHHGFARNLHFWRPWVPLLARDYRVLRYDARGCGQSTIPPPGTPYALHELVSDALALIDALEIERVHWVGEASGGIVGLALALEHPARVRSVSLCNTPFRLPRATNDLFVAEEVERLGVGHWARQTLTNRLDVDKVDPRWIEWSIAEFDKNPPHASIAQHDMIADTDLFARLREIRPPVLVMAGTGSRITPAAQMQEMYGQLPNARLKLFDGYGQGIAFSIPERCAAEVKGFLRALDASPANNDRPASDR